MTRKEYRDMKSGYLKGYTLDMGSQINACDCNGIYLGHYNKMQGITIAAGGRGVIARYDDTLSLINESWEENRKRFGV